METAQRVPTTASLPGPVVVIGGPTASGKSALAALVARQLGGPVVGADAMQVYRGMDIGTAKDTDGSVDVRMVDVADIGDVYSVALYQRDARAHVDAALAAGVTPIVCGGTGLYVDAVIDELSFPKGGATSESRRRWEAFAAEHGDDALYAELARRDARAAALVHPHNVRRVVRALELCDRGMSYAEQNRSLHQRRPHYDAHVYAVTMSRARLYARIDARVDAMIERGLLDEVRTLAARGLRETTTARQAIGYKELLDYLDGTATLQEAIATIKLRSRRYAKRQLSWIRRRDDVTWLDCDALEPDEAAHVVLEGLGRAGAHCGEQGVADRRAGG